MRRIKFPFAAAGLIVILLVAGCNPAVQGTQTPNLSLTETIVATVAPVSTGTPTAIPDLPVKVTSQVVVSDVLGNTHILGEVLNGSESPVEAIQLTVIALNAAGASLLQSETGEPVQEVAFSPLISTLATGQSAPFDFALPGGSAIPAVFQVFVTSFQPSTANLQTLQIENTQVMSGENGEAVLVGELVNPNPVSVSIQGLAAKLKDGSNALVSTGGAGLSAGLLLPAGDTSLLNRTPFKIPFYAALPPGGSWQVFVDAIDSGTAAEIDTTQLAIDQSFTYYEDARGTSHLVSSIKNPFERAFSVQLVAGLYGGTGSVMDMSLLAIPLDLQPGEELPFDVHDFLLVNGKPDLLAKLDAFTLQVDPSRTVVSTRVWTGVEVENEQEEQGEKGVWTFSGRVTNTGSAEIDRFVVMATLTSHSTGKVVAVTTTTLLNPAGRIAQGMAMDYKVEVLADPLESQELDPVVKVYAATDQPGG